MLRSTEPGESFRSRRGLSLETYDGAGIASQK